MNAILPFAVRKTFGTFLLLADRPAHFHAVDTRRVVLKYRERWSVFGNQCSHLVHVREKFGANAGGANGPGKCCCHLCVRDTEKHGHMSTEGSELGYGTRDRWRRCLAGPRSPSN